MWTFRSNILYSPDGNSWQARSGRVGGAEAIPKGMYTMGKITSLLASANIAYSDLSGDVDKGKIVPFAWWCTLTPDPGVTTRGRPENGRFGIHPDGDVPGTEGCIGLTDANTRPAYDALRKSQDKRLKVE